jgi:hypothetical protein
MILAQRLLWPVTDGVKFVVVGFVLVANLIVLVSAVTRAAGRFVSLIKLRRGEWIDKSSSAHPRALMGVVIKERFMQRSIKFYLFLGLSIIVSSATGKDGKGEEGVRTVILRNGANTSAMKWDDVFIEGEEINFLYPDSTYQLFIIPSFLRNNKGDYIIPDGSSKAIKLFDHTGKFVSIIGKWGGQGPGEFETLGALTLNNKGDLFVFDVANYRLSTFAAPKYTYSGSQYLKVVPSSLIVTPQNHFITYGFSSEYVLNKYDTDGNLLRSAFKPIDKKLHIFTNRFKLGGIVDNNGKGIFMVYPANYEIYYYDYNLNLTTIIKTEQSYKFRPTADKFPESLSPYAITSQHLKWWENFLHIGRVYVIQDNIIGVTLYESESKKMSFKYCYFNIYNANGEIYAEGLKVPHNGSVNYSKDGYVFVSTDAQIGPNDEIIPPRLYRYKFRKR